MLEADEENQEAEWEKFWVERFGEARDDVLELVETGFMVPGDKYGLEQTVGGSWTEIYREHAKTINEAVNQVFGINPHQEPIRTYHEEGVEGAPSQAGGNTKVFATNNSAIELHIVAYNDPRLATRFDITVAGNEE